MNLLDRISYDTGGYTVQEILSSFCKKILEIIDLVNKNEEVCDEAHALIENIRNEVVPELVEDIMKELQDTGYFDNLVNVTLIEQLRTELTTLLNQTIADCTTRLDNFDSQLDTITNNVENLRTTVEKILNELSNKKIIDLKNENDFNVNDISVCINRIFSNIESYTTVKLNIGTCYLTNPINITMKEGCELLLNCKIICKNDINAININGNCVSNNIYIKTLISFNNLNFNIVNGNGLTLDNYYNSSIKIGEILGFNTGLLLKGTLGTQYNKIDFFSISNCKEPIKLLTTEETQWVNENTFTGGRIGGNVGITLNGISGKDIINNNKFYNIGFEGVNELLIKSIGARYNSYFNPRVLENYPELKWVEESGSCIGNKYYFTFPVNINMFKLDYLSQIIGTVTNGTKTISQTGAICDWDITADKMVMQYNYYLNGILMTDDDFNKLGGCITLSECFKEVYCKLSTSARKLRIDKHLLYNGFTFNLYITSASTGSLNLEYYNKDGGLVTGTNFLTNGVYKVTMYNDLLVYTKTGDEFKMV